MSDIVTNYNKFKKGWTGGLPETPCGFGSKMSSTQAQRDWLPSLVKKYGIKTVADIGAGDLNWIPHVKWDVEYTPYDLIPRHESVTRLNILEEVAPKVDMLMCLWVLNHMPFEQARLAFQNLRESGSKYLLMTHRKKWELEQPEELNQDYIDMIVLDKKKGDTLRLIKL